MRELRIVPAQKNTTVAENVCPTLSIFEMSVSQIATEIFVGPAVASGRGNASGNATGFSAACPEANAAKLRSRTLVFVSPRSYSDWVNNTIPIKTRGWVEVNFDRVRCWNCNCAPQRERMYRTS